MSDNDNAKTTHTCLHCAIIETAAIWLREHQGIDAVANDKSIAYNRLTAHQHDLLAASFAMAAGQIVGAAPPQHRSSVSITSSAYYAKAMFEQADVTDAVKN